ncbi:MAG: Gfo/Idh/MocA family oxidoreductase, partial [Thermomicrobiales bacterium]
MVRIGIVGAGLRGQMYASALADVTGIDVVAFAEPAPTVAESTFASTGIPVVSSHDKLLHEIDPDAIVIATPDFAHREAAISAALAGKHVLIEKPLAMTLADAWAIRDAVNHGEAQCLVGFENRWNPHVLSAKRTIESGAVGTHLTSSATLSNTWFVPTQMLSWAARSSPAWFLMPHSVDMLLWFSGRNPVSVSAVASQGQLAQRGIDTEDVVHALICFDDGTTASLTSAWILPDAHPAIVDFRFQFIGTEGAISGDPIRQGLDVTTDRLRTAGTLGSRIGIAQVGAPIWMAQAWATGLITNQPVGPGVEQGVLVTEVICAIERSFQTRQ